MLSALSADSIVVVSLSDQSAASLAAATGMTVQDAFQCASGFCRSFLRANFVVDMRWAQRVALNEVASEYLQRCTNQAAALPLIVSSCPGWVCYCEKSHPELLPLLSRVMSAQAIVGAYVKGYLGKTSRLVFHVSIQPCFDKKLEAARPDLRRPGSAERDTDCVLSSLELLDWMQEVDTGLPWRSPLDSAPLETIFDASLYSSHSCEALQLMGSGAYHQFVALRAAEELFGARNLALSSFEYQSMRNQNHRVMRLPLSLVPGGDRFEFCVAYGFQHTQNIVRWLNRKSPAVSKYGFIELMACPEGCLNGGGQVPKIGASIAALNAYEHFLATHAASDDCSVGAEGCPRKIPRTETTSSCAAILPSLAAQHPLFTAASVYSDWLGGAAPGGAEAQAALACPFHDRKKEAAETPLAISLALKW